MRKFKKALAVVSAAVMTMAMSVTAFADHTVTYHFYNAAGWETVGAWVKQGIDWKEDCMPTDTCVLKDTDDGSAPHEPIWPGAQMVAEGGGWYKITCTYTDAAKGSSMKFNNYVGDATPGDTTSEADIQKLRDAGIKLTDVATKEETQQIMIKKNELTGNEYWINWDGNLKGALVVLGKSDMISAEAPAAYTEAMNAGNAGSTDNNAGSTDNNTGSTDNNAGTTTGNNNAGTTTGNNNAGSSNSGTKAPTTGDSAAVSVVLLGLASAVAVVAAKKKVNA